MKTPKQSRNSEKLFLVDVEDPETSETFQTLSISRTPAMLLSFAANKFTEAASAHFKDNFDLGPVDWRMLFLLARMPGVTAIQAAKTMGVDKGTVSRSVGRLSKTELIVAGELHANGRSRGLSLSSTGRVLHDQILAEAVSQQAHLLKGFSVSEIGVFCDMLIRFTENLEELIESDQVS
ncbi:MAG: MarR family winged helix-turn-helix transcriptional regulator [Granulosicoccus sp.]